MPKIRIATRSSELALWQAEHVKTLLEEAGDGVDVEIVHIKTLGDRNQTDALRQFGGTGVFTREVQKSVLDGDTDIAVHSLKDLQTDPTAGLTLAGIPDRASTADALLLPQGSAIGSLDELPKGATIGTGSPRRQAQLLNVRPDLQMKEIRGNVGTRIRKLDEGDYDAIVLAEAGLSRLGLEARISCLLKPPLMYEAVGQGALGIECREDDESVVAALESISNQDVVYRTRAERILLAELRAGCHAPLGVSTQIEAGQLTLTAVLLSLDGTKRLQASDCGVAENAAETGKAVASQLLGQGGSELMASDIN